MAKELSVDEILERISPGSVWEYRRAVVLKALSGGPYRYGDIARRASRIGSLDETTVTTTLNNLRAKGLVDKGIVNGRDLYSLTEDGKKFTSE